MSSRELTADLVVVGGMSGLPAADNDALVVTVTNNYVRKRLHRLASPVTARTLRLVDRTTHGVGHARVFELRTF